MSDSTEKNPDGTERSINLARRSLLGAGALGAASLAAGSAIAGGTMSPEAGPVEVAEGLARFSGQVVLITGATSGIGEATARSFAREGAQVAFCGRRAELGAEVAASINGDAVTQEAGGAATFVQCDVRDHGQVAQFVADVAEQFGRLDIAFNNAGIFLPVAELQDMEPAAYRDMIDTNLNGVAYAMMAELPIMIEQERGVIVNMASVAGHLGFGNTPHYNASKHGVIGLTKAAAKVNAARGIRISSLSPLAVDTPMLRRSFDVQGLTYEQMAPNFTTPRIMQPEEMARAVLFLADPSTTYFTGADLDVTGGQLA